MVSDVRGAMHGFVQRLAVKWALTIPAAARATPAVPEKPVKENIRHAAVAVHMHGMERLVLVRQHINMLAAAPATPVAQALPAVANMLLANALRDINGKMVNVRQKRYGDSAVAMLHSVHLVISCSATELAARIRYQAKRR